MEINCKAKRPCPAPVAIAAPAPCAAPCAQQVVVARPAIGGCGVGCAAGMPAVVRAAGVPAIVGAGGCGGVPVLQVCSSGEKKEEEKKAE